MHLLEAALAWMETGRDPAWEKLAAEIVNLALAHFIDSETRVLREVFDAAWSPAPGEAGLVTEPGHQFEWSWLLERWSRLKNDAPAHDAALTLFAAGRRGVDAARNAAIDETDPDMTPRRATARLWPQTERLKAALLLGEDDGQRTNEGSTGACGAISKRPSPACGGTKCARTAASWTSRRRPARCITSSVRSRRNPPWLAPATKPVTTWRG